ncbi:hypothetical protein ZHAS_00009447 [Anopheles sinensis]|uniref:Uncharacterized protein n=1 Tax=Anopheles sinensis TaxID=74873 RepID=A0A084VV94_ANOSI|nr:hypothetical protein ZHAS_00009447 [Anopheles sinensis]
MIFVWISASSGKVLISLRCTIRTSAGYQDSGPVPTKADSLPDAVSGTSLFGRSPLSCAVLWAHRKRINISISITERAISGPHKPSPPPWSPFGRALRRGPSQSWY